MFDGSFVLGTGANYFFFNTSAFSDGAPATLGGTPSLACRVNGGSAQTAGLTLSADHDTITGLNRVAFDVDNATLALSDGDLVEVLIAAGTVGGTSVVGKVVGRVAITDGSLLAQTITDIQNAILNRVLSGNHDTAGTPGALLQNADAATSDVKAKTDQLGFSAGGNVQADIQEVDGAAVAQGGSDPASPYGV